MKSRLEFALKSRLLFTLPRRLLSTSLSVSTRSTTISSTSTSSLCTSLRSLSTDAKSLLSEADSQTKMNQVTPASSSSGTSPPLSVSKRLTFAPIPWQRPMSRVLSIPKSPARWVAKSMARIAKIKEGHPNQAKLIKEHAKQKPPRQMKRGLLQYVKKKSWER